MKQWKNGEQFSAKDYTSERDGLVEKLNSVDSKVVSKGQKIFVISEKKPDQDNMGHIWMNPNQFNTKAREYEYNINTSFVSSGFKFTEILTDFEYDIQTYFITSGFKLELIESKVIEQEVRLDFTISGYKEQVEFDIIEQEIQVTSTLSGYKEQLLYKSISGEAVASFTTSSYKEQLLYKSISGEAVTTFTTSSYKEQLQYVPVVEEIVTTFTTSSYKNVLEYEPIVDEIRATFTTSSYKEQLRYEPIVEEIVTTFTTSSYKEQLRYEPIVDEIVTTFTTSSYKEQLRYEPISKEINVGIYGSGYKAQLEYNDISKDIVTSISGSGYKTELSYNGISKEILVNSSASGFKKIDIYARSDAPFTTIFTLGGINETVGIPQSSYEVVSGIRENDTLAVSVPSNFIYNNVKYLYVNTTFSIGASSTGTRTDTSFTLSIFGTTYLNFNYEPVEFIDVLAKAVDLNAGDQISADVTFSTLNDSSVLQYSSTETVEGQYGIKHQFENIPDYKIKIQPPTSLAIGGNTYLYLGMEGNADGDENTGDFLFGTNSSNYTYTPNPTGISPRVDETIYVKFNYDKQLNYTLRAGLTVDNDPSSDSTYLQTTLTRQFGSESSSTMTISNTVLGYSVVGTRIEGTTYSVSVPSYIGNINGEWSFNFWTITAGGSGNYFNPKTGTLNQDINLQANYQRIN